MLQQPAEPRLATDLFKAGDNGWLFILPLAADPHAYLGATLRQQFFHWSETRPQLARMALRDRAYTASHGVQSNPVRPGTRPGVQNTL